jgi:hypothetical protein
MRANCFNGAVFPDPDDGPAFSFFEMNSIGTGFNATVLWSAPACRRFGFYYGNHGTEKRRQAGALQNFAGIRRSWEDGNPAFHGS